MPLHQYGDTQKEPVASGNEQVRTIDEEEPMTEIESFFLCGPTIWVDAYIFYVKHLYIDMSIQG